MELADQAVLARQRGDAEAVVALSRAAFSKERAAADRVANLFDLEPTRSVLHRSAAVLAIECNQLREAERLIGRALAGNPPDGKKKFVLLNVVFSKRKNDWGDNYANTRSTASHRQFYFKYPDA